MPGRNRKTGAMPTNHKPDLEDKCSTSMGVDVEQWLKERSERFRITSSLLEDTEDEDHARLLRRFTDLRPVEGPISTINLNRKGLTIFNARNLFKLYDEVTAYKTFMENKVDSDVDHPIYQVSMKDLNKTIRLRLLKMPFKKQAILNNLSLYIFKLMCVSKDPFTVRACLDFLVHHQNKDKGEIKSWAPTVDDIICAFKNYGAPDFMFDDAVQLQSGSEESEDSIPKDLKDNVLKVTKFLAHSLFRNSYPEEDLDKLLMIILSLSFDRNFIATGLPGELDISKCLYVILHSYEESVWTRVGKISDLCKKFIKKFSMIETKDWYFLIVYSISTPEVGNRIGYSLIYVLLRKWLCQEMPEDCESFSLKDVAQAVKRNGFCKLEPVDQYHVIMLLNRLVSWLILSPENKAYLDEVFDMVSYLRVNEGADIVDYHTIKQALTVARCCWRDHISQVEQSY